MTELVCPQCESDTVTTTLVGHPVGRDANKVGCSTCGWTGTAQDWLLIADMRKDLEAVADWETKHDMKIGEETREGFRRWAGDKSEEIIHKHYPVDRLLEFERPLLRRDDR